MKEASLKNLKSYENLYLTALYKRHELHNFIGKNMEALSDLDEYYKTVTGLEDDLRIIRAHLLYCSIFIIMGRHEEAEKNARDAAVLSEKTGNRSWLGNACFYLGKVYFNAGRYDDSLDHFMRALEIKEALNEPISELCAEISYLYYRKNEPESQFKFIKKAYDSASGGNDLAVKTHTIVGLGMYYLQQKNYDEALNYFKRSLEMSERLMYTIGIANSLYNIGVIYKNTQRHDDAVRFLIKAYKLIEPTRNLFGTFSCLQNLGSCCIRTGQPARALKYFCKALELSMKLNYPPGVYNCLVGSGEANFCLGRRMAAFDDYKKALHYAKEKGLPQDAELEKRIAELRNALGVNESI